MDGSMFLRYFVELDLPVAQAEAALLDSPSTWLPALADSAVEGAEPLLAEVGIGQGSLRVAKRVTVRLGRQSSSHRSSRYRWAGSRADGCCQSSTPSSNSAHSARTAPNSPSAAATSLRSVLSAAPSTGWPCTASQRPPSRTFSIAWPQGCRPPGPSLTATSLPKQPRAEGSMVSSNGPAEVPGGYSGQAYAPLLHLRRAGVAGGRSPTAGGSRRAPRTSPSP